MILNDSPIVDRRQRHVIRSMIVAVLAMGALLLGLLAIHSAGTGQKMSVTLPAASAHAEQTNGVDAMVASGVAAVTAVAHTDNGLLIAMTCGVLLILASLVLLPRLTRLPSEYHRLLDAGGRVDNFVGTAPLHIHRPSLTVLSISRT